ncbi:N-acetyl-alpha-D-glucosaminyl L-malate synthase BshA [Longibacter salinarum]|uniref:N-acetyl-alpha-D-glucosaminyl L-malate synthase BshA n=1 Tax=Longibacter salinarum TaxID=1850348 RepID=A0A2A8D155_9BACT|nr:N-acetyl-alpha-D-glucosaminyl L-malate synthase BshA [Longibacter salinarum]PEN14378.1 N-acetyl-alpha-D-glucosaminyl L-malate synthase BshA [Longibacter salinarum]
MKIGITCYPTYGGSGVVATELGKALANRGHEIHFISSSMPFRLSHIAGNIFFHEVNVQSYPLFEYPPYTLSLTSKMVDIAKHAGLDLMHVHYAIPHATSAVMARQILATEGVHMPVVTTLHGTDITLIGQDPSFAPVVTWSINESDGVTAVSNYLRQETYDHFDIDNGIEVIPNFIDTERFFRQNKEHFKQALCPNGEKVIAHVSNFRPVKNAQQVVEIFHRLREDDLPVKLLLVGDGPDRVPSERKARDLGVYDDIRFLGKQDPVEEILSIADVFLMPSGSETFGLAALEAMACDVPVVASNVGGLPELVEDGETGFLCELDDIDAFEEACRRLLVDEDLHTRMSDAARSRAEDTFDIRQIVPHYERYYEKVRENLLESVG